MLGTLILFAGLYALLALVEPRYGNKADGFVVAGAVIVPTIVSVLVRIGGHALSFSPNLPELLAFVAFPVTTFLVFWKIVDIPFKRSAAYAVAAVVIALVAQVGLTLLLTALVV